jgi:prepilin-type N-terminal cleavage/methylation domain-containing protein
MSAARARRSGGFTLIELVIGIALSALVAGAIFSFFSSSTEAGRIHESQTRAQESARTALARLGADVRQAAGPGGGAPVASISSTELVVYADLRRSNDPALSFLPSKVRYALQSGSLIREAAAPIVGAGGAITYPAAYSGRTTLATGLVNAATGAPLFAGIDSDGNGTSVAADVAQIAVRVQVGHMDNKRSAMDEVDLDITLRNA